jgi:hypothetical protein
MKITLTNGVVLTPIMVTGAPATVQGTRRDTLSFIFPETESIMTLDAAFSEDACEIILIEGDDGSESIHKGYTIRSEIKKAGVVVSPETSDSDAVVENRITVTMAQRTHMETKLAALSAKLGL